MGLLQREKQQGNGKESIGRKLQYDLQSFYEESMANTYCTLCMKHIQVFLVTLIYIYVRHYICGVITI